MKRIRPTSGGSKPFARTLAKSLLFLCLGTFASAVPARVDEVHGDVQKRSLGALGWVKVNPGDKAEEGSSFRTGPNSEVDILTVQGHHFVIRSESVVEFKSLQPDDTQTLLESGRVLSKVHKLKDTEKFSLQTPTAVCAVRGTEFETVSGQSGTLVAVFHGVVGVATPGMQNEIRVPAGQMTSVHNGTIELPRPIPHQSRHVSENQIGRAHV